MSPDLTGVTVPPSILTMLEENRLVHALCLEGEPGPALQMAHWLAGAVLCERQQGIMCGECLHCRKVLAGVHADVNLPDPDAGGYKKDAVRTLRADIYRSPHEGRAKVMIFRQAQTMSAEVQNLLLKVMEEPPENTYFILTCGNRYRLLSTVLSRMVAVMLPQRGDGALLDELLSADEGLAAKAVLAAMQNGGGYRLLAALQPFEKNRPLYTTMLQTVDRLVGMEQVRQNLGISMQQCLRVRRALAAAIGRNESNGYLPMISAALNEQISRR